MTNLHGRRILNTRPIGQAEQWNQMIRDANGIPATCSLLKIIPLSFSEKVFDYSAMDYLIFISPNAAELFVRGLSKSEYDRIASKSLIAIGEGTATVLNHHGLTVHHQPSLFDSEHLLELPCLLDVEGKTIGLVKGQGGRRLIQETLLQRGANLVFIEVYQRVLADEAVSQFEILWRDEAVDIILLTSTEAMLFMVKIATQLGALSWLLNKPCFVMGDRMARHALDLGFLVVHQLKPKTWIKQLEDYCGQSGQPTH